MKSKDIIYGQNWVEQFRYERKSADERMTDDRRIIWELDVDIYEKYTSSPVDVINSSFPWYATLQGHRTWSCRCSDLRGIALGALVR